MEDRLLRWRAVLARHRFLLLARQRESVNRNKFKPKSGMTEIPVSVRQKGGSNLKNTSAFVCMLAALAAVSPSDAAKPTSCAATFAGRIAYTTGVIHICDG